MKIVDEKLQEVWVVPSLAPQFNRLPSDATKVQKILNRCPLLQVRGALKLKEGRTPPEVDAWILDLVTALH